MNNPANETYLVTEVTTATPQKLQLMLINAIIQAVHKAQKYWLNQDRKEARKHLGRAKDILYDIFNGFDFKANSELVNKVAAVYLFIYRTLTYADIDDDLNKLEEALRILEIERDTWQKVCKLQALSESAQSKAKTGHAPIAPNIFSNGETPPDSSHTSFSLEA
jgi:flagellar secretion chaperone FliS